MGNITDKGVERLIYIIKDLDMITKLEAGDLSLDVERFDILDVIQNVFDLYEMKAAKKKISLIFDMAYEEPIYVNADKEKIQQVLSNLIVNSIKYGRQKGTTEVSIENLIKNKVIVRITDNGEGIDASGELPGGKRFSSPKELKSIITGHIDEFSRNLVERLLAYALCRKLEGYDEIVVDDLMKDIARDGYRMQTLISAVVTCYPFTHRRIQEEKDLQ